MTQDELVAAFRSAADDTNSQQYLWSDEEIKKYLCEAEAEATDRANLLVETTDDTYCLILALAGTALYDTNSLIFQVRRVTINGTPLHKKTTAELDSEWPNWEYATGLPSRYIFEKSTIRLVPTPTEDISVRLEVVRGPIEMTATGPEIHPRLHLKLLDWALHLAYSKRGADTYDPTLAASYALQFTLSFGEPSSANTREQQLQQFRPDDSDRPTWM